MLSYRNLYFQNLYKTLKTFKFRVRSIPVMGKSSSSDYKYISLTSTLLLLIAWSPLFKTFLVEDVSLKTITAKHWDFPVWGLHLRLTDSISPYFSKYSFKCFNSVSQVRFWTTILRLFPFAMPLSTFGVSWSDAPISFWSLLTKLPLASPCEKSTLVLFLSFELMKNELKTYIREWAYNNFFNHQLLSDKWTRKLLESQAWERNKIIFKLLTYHIKMLEKFRQMI